MSLEQAIEDGILVCKEENIGRTSYYPPCSICGASVKTPEYTRGAKYICRDCRRMIVEYKVSDEGVAIDKKEKKLATALNRISKHHNIDDYKDAVEKVRKGFSRTHSYESVEEIMVALELLRKGFTIYHQVDVGGYRVDFVIPELKVILEVDGELYHRRNTTQILKENIRDDVLKGRMEYEVVHMPTKCINADITKLVYAIRRILESRKKE